MALWVEIKEMMVSKDRRRQLPLFYPEESGKGGTDVCGRLVSFVAGSGESLVEGCSFPLWGKGAPLKQGWRDRMDIGGLKSLEKGWCNLWAAWVDLRNGEGCLSGVKGHWRLVIQREEMSLLVYSVLTCWPRDGRSWWPTVCLGLGLVRWLPRKESWWVGQETSVGCQGHYLLGP